MRKNGRGGEEAALVVSDLAQVAEEARHLGSVPAKTGERNGVLDQRTGKAVLLGGSMLVGVYPDIASELARWSTILWA